MLHIFLSLCFYSLLTFSSRRLGFVVWDRMCPCSPPCLCPVPPDAAGAGACSLQRRAWARRGLPRSGLCGRLVPVRELSSESELFLSGPLEGVPCFGVFFQVSVEWNVSLCVFAHCDSGWPCRPGTPLHRPREPWAELQLVLVTASCCTMAAWHCPASEPAVGNGVRGCQDAGMRDAWCCPPPPCRGRCCSFMSIL